MVAKQGSSVHAEGPHLVSDHLPIAVGLVGVGRWGANLLRVIQAGEGVELAHVAEPRFAVRVPGVQRSSTLPRLLADPRIRAVLIASPSDQHAAHAQLALAAGRHVFVEKPLAHSIDAARALCEEAARRDLRLMVGHILRYDLAVEKLRSAQRDGTLGRIASLSLVRLRQRASAEDPWWSLAPHDLSLIEYVLDSPVEAVACRHREKVVLAEVRTRSGTRVTIEVGFGDRSQSQARLSGELGQAVYDPALGGLWLDVSGGPRQVSVPDVEPLHLEIQHFVECIRSGATPLTDGWEGLRVVRALEAGDRSRGSGGAWQTV